MLKMSCEKPLLPQKRYAKSMFTKRNENATGTPMRKRNDKTLKITMRNVIQSIRPLNSKSEIRNSKQPQIEEFGNPIGTFPDSNFRIFILPFIVSDFDIRISNFFHPQSCRLRVRLEGFP